MVCGPKGVAVATGLSPSRLNFVAKRTARRATKLREWIRLHPRCAICPNPIRVYGHLTCSQRCSQIKWNWFTRKANRKPIPRDRVCIGCGTPIDSDKRFGTMYCTKRCQGTAQARGARRKAREERIAA